jgi:hypothetical protein
VAEEAEAGDVGHRMHGAIFGESGADAVEQGGRGDELVISLARQRALLERRRIDADAERLGEDQRIAGLGVGVAADVALHRSADDGKAVDRLR